MSDITIDRLEIELSDNSSEVSKSLEKLNNTFKKLKSTITGGLGLKSLNDEFKEFSKVTSSIDNSSLSKMDQFIASVSKLRESKGLGLPKNLSADISNIVGSLRKVDNHSFSKLGKLSDTLRGFDRVKNFNISGTFAKNLGKVLDSLKTMNGNDLYKLEGLSTSLKSFSDIGKNNLSNLATNLSKFPMVYQELKKMDLKDFAADMKLLSDALAPLATNIDKIGRGFSALPSKIRSLVNVSEKYHNVNQKVKTSQIGLVQSLKSTALQMIGSYALVKKVSDQIGTFIQKSTEYVENLNLFHASMGRFGRVAEEYSETVNGALGIDKSEWIRNQGIFMTLTTGFGVMEERANKMSKNLTQLGYDISSFFNITFKDAMTKLQSGMSGELEPLRRLGYDLSQAKLKAVALSLGIDKTFESMTQAEKAQLRYHAIMTQVTASHGDLARTLNTPANQLRIMNSLFQQAGRAIGNIFIPALNAILPVAISVLKVVRELADHIALMFGFKLPQIDYSGIEHAGGAVDGLADNLDNATKAAKALKSATLGFDELNVISPNQGGSGKGGVGGASGGWKDFPLEEYDFLGKSKIKEHLEGINPLVETLKDNMALILSSVKAIGTAFITWKGVKFAESLASKILGDIDAKKWNSVAIGLTVTVASMTFLSDGIEDMAKNGLNLSNFLQTALGGVGSAWGIATTLGAFVGKALAWKIAIPVVIAFGAFKFFDSWNKEQIKKDLEKRFGEISLTKSEAQELAKNIMKSDLTLELDLFVDQQKARNQIEGQLKESVEKIEKLKVKMQFDLNYDKDTLLSTAKELHSNMGQFLDEKQVELLLAFKHTFKNSKLGLELANELNDSFSSQNHKLKDLGNQLKQVISEGFVGGEWIGNKKEEALKLMSEIEQIKNQYDLIKTEIEIKHYAKLLLDPNLSQESYERVNSKLKELKDFYFFKEQDIQIQSKLGLEVIKADGKISTTAFKELTESIEARTNENQMQISLTNLKFNSENLKQKYSAELKVFSQSTIDLSKKELKRYEEEIKPIVGDMANILIPQYAEIADGYTWDFFFADYKAAFEGGIINSGITGTARESLKELLENLDVENQVQEYEKLMMNAFKMGVEIPENVRKGFADIASIQALSGSVEGMQRHLGMQITSSPEFLASMATAEDYGSQIPQSVKAGVLSNLSYVNEGGRLIVTALDTGISFELGEITPAMKQNFLDFGVDITKSLHKGVDDKIKATDFKQSFGKIELDSKQALAFNKFVGIGTNLVQGLFGGITDKLRSLNYFKDTFNRVTTSVKQVFAIHSPSRVFMEIGDNIGEGLYLGMDSKGDKIKSVYNSVPDSFKNGLQVQLNEVFKNIALGIFGNMENGFKQIQDLFAKLPGWMDTNVSGEMKKIFDSMIGNVQSQINSATSMLSSLQTKASNIIPSGDGGFGGAGLRGSYSSRGSLPRESGALISRTKWGTVRRRATGGLPPVGEIFIARESGPEMVGKIGNNSAVANNEQIVDGIAKGVANANNEQNQLLREQNQLLKALLNKDTGFRLDGKSLSKSIEKYQNERGYQLVTGGV